MSGLRLDEQDNERQDGQEQDGEEQYGEGQDGEGQDGERQDGEGQDGERQDPETNNTNVKSDYANATDIATGMYSPSNHKLWKVIFIAQCTT